MKFLLLFASWLSLVHSFDHWLDQRHPKSINSLSRAGYSSSVIHNPYYKTLDDILGRDLIISPSHHTSSVTYRENDPPRTIENYKRAEEADLESQLFSVGYSVKFKNNNSSEVQNNSEYNGYGMKIFRPRPEYIPKYKKGKYEGEIITGKQKNNENVEAPEASMSPNEFVSQALMKQKHLISGIKPKQKQKQEIPSTGDRSENLIKGVNFSPKVQHYIKELEKIKEAERSKEHSRKNEKNEYHNWKSIGPGVEIIKSSEIPINSKFIVDSNRPKLFDSKPAMDNDRPKQFYYEQAMKNKWPQLFDHMLDRDNERSKQFDHKLTMSNEKPKLFDHNFPKNNEKPKLFDHRQAASNSKQFDMSDALEMPTNEFGENYAQNADLEKEEYNESTETNEKKSDVSSEDQMARAMSNTNQMPPLPKKPENSGIIQKVPMDMSLVKEPVITSNSNSIPKDPRLLPIHFDTSPIEYALKTQQEIDFTHGYKTPDKIYPYAFGNQPVEIKHFHIYPDPRYNPHSGFVPLEKDAIIRPVSPKNTPPSENQEYRSPQPDFKIYGKAQPMKNPMPINVNTNNKKNQSNEKSRQTNNNKYMNTDRLRQPRFGGYPRERSEFRSPSIHPSNIYQRSYY